MQINPYIEEFIKLCEAEKINMRFDHANTLNYTLEPVDLLFIDTLHTYSQLSEELKLHHTKVKKYLIFHDTISYGTQNEHNTPDEKQGLVPAIKEFLQNKFHRLKWVHQMTLPILLMQLLTSVHLIKFPEVLTL